MHFETLYAYEIRLIVQAFYIAVFKCVSNAHYDDTPMQYAAIFQSCKNDKFQMKNCDIFSYFFSVRRF